MQKNTYLFLFVINIIASAVISLNAQPWYNGDWGYRCPVTIENPGGTELTDFQIKISLNNSNFSFGHAKSDGSDLRITLNDGVTELPFWIEEWDQAGTSAVVWVKVTTIPIAGTSIYLYYGNATAITKSDGLSTFRFFDDFESWITTSGSSGWVDQTAQPTAIADQTAATYNGRIYLIGGYSNGPNDPKSTNYEYNPTTNTWAIKSPMPTARWGMVAVEFNGKIYVFGGAATGGAGDVNKNEVYDPLLDSWSTLADIPANIARQGIMGLKYGDKIHLFYESYHYEYDPATDLYTQKSNVPLPRFWCTTAVVGSKIYLIGGHHAGVATNDNQEYDPTNDIWTTKSPLPKSLWGMTRENPVINGKIYVTHGLDGSVFQTSNYVYDPGTNTWDLKGPATHPRDGVGCGVINNKLYVIGGRADFSGPYGLNYN